MDGPTELIAEPRASEERESVRPSRRFRAWGDAHERDRAPSVWDRFTTWLRSLFSRDREHAVERALAAVNHEPVRIAPGAPRTSFDDLDAPWTEDPYPVAERRSSRPSRERPSIEDFSSNWDGTYGRDDEAEPEDAAAAEIEPTVADVTEAPAADADALWDSPAVVETPSAPPPSLAAQDFAEVWTAPQESPASAPPDFELPPVEAPKKKGFFARLFGRGDAPVERAASDERQPVDPWRAAGVEGFSSARGLEPADADFADDVAAATVPSVNDFADDVAAATVPSTDDFAADDFAEDDSAEPPTNAAVTSIDHSADDAASLAAFLAMPAPSAPREDEDPIAEIAMEAVVDEAAVEDVTPELPALPRIEPDEKPGFFSGLLKRVSRSMFVPKVQAESPAPTMEIEPEPEAVAAEPDLEPVAELEVVVDSEPAAELDVVADPEVVAELEPEPVSMESSTTLEFAPPPMPTPPAAADEELSATQPFPAFRDARDDFADQDTGDGAARATEKVEIPVFDEGEKTDEFQVVEAPAPEGATMETQPVGFFGRLFGRKDAAVSGEGAATPAPAEDTIPFVLAKFRTFYNEIIREKHQKSDVISGFATAVLSAAPSDMADPDFAAQLLSKRLSEMLELQAAEANWTGGDAAKYYPEAQYAMVALADETFSTIDWPGRSAWHKNMLEPRMYGTRAADIEFFKRIDKLLKDPAPEKGARDLARLYLMVIASGFRGKFRVPNVRRPLAEYRRRLYEFSHQADPLELYARDRRIFSEAAEHTLASRAVGRFTSAQRWIATVLVLVILYFGISHYAWNRLSADLKDIMSRIDTDASTGRTP